MIIMLIVGIFVLVGMSSLVALAWLVYDPFEESERKSEDKEMEWWNSL